MMNFHSVNRIFAFLLSTACTFGAMQTASAQTPDEPRAQTQTDQSAENKAKEIRFPVPTAEEGAELLQSEGISFEADATPMPDIAATVRSARKNRDASSMFITHVMYRDRIGDIAYYNEGKKQSAELSTADLHREMIRWRDAAFEANYEPAILATSPSVQYEISPLFANDDEFKKGLNWLKTASAHGYGNAEYILGLIYFNGVGTKKDKKKGFELLVRAASHGVVNAYYAVGMIYEMGLNGPKDAEKSLYWLEKAAHYGSKDAIFILAMKYADGIDVPKDEKKADALEELDQKYHVWTKLHRTKRDQFYHKYCVYKNDESSIGWSTRENGECESYIAHYNADDIDEGYVDYPIDVTAESSLDYKIDYRLASLWLKKNADIHHENIYILRAQAHHLTGCRGGLDGSKFKDIDLYPDEEDDEATDFDDSTRTFKLALIALNDYRTKPAAILEWLNEKADAGDKEALFTLGQLFEQYDTHIKRKNQHTEVFELLYGKTDLYKPLYKKLKLKSDLVKAYEYYDKADAFEDARRVAIMLGDEARKKKDPDKAAIWYDKAIQSGEKAYHHHTQNHSDIMVIKEWARRTANTAFIKGDDAKAVEWYLRALDQPAETDPEGKYNYIEFTSILRLAQLYNSGAAVVQNKDKAIDLYKKLAQWLSQAKEPIGWNHFDFAHPNELYDISYSNYYANNFDDDFAAEDINAILSLADIYEHSTQTQKPNPTEAIRMYRLAWELNISLYSDNWKESDAIKRVHLAHAKKMIESLPMLDLQSAVEKQILAEKDKDPDQFFIFNKILHSCEKEFRKADYETYGERDAAPDLECSEILPAYQESIQKAVTAITALSIAKGSADPDEINNTFYYLAIYKGNDRDYRTKLLADSAVYAALEDYEYSTVYHYFRFGNDDRNRLFHIWYLRQIPYAAKEVFKTLHAPQSWDEYMAQARERMEQDETLRNGFGYEPYRAVQKM